MKFRVKNVRAKIVGFAAATAAIFVSVSATAAVASYKSIHPEQSELYAGEPTASSGILVHDFFIGKDLKADISDFSNFQLASSVKTKTSESRKLGLVLLSKNYTINFDSNNIPGSDAIFSYINIIPAGAGAAAQINCSEIGVWTNTETTNFDNQAEPGNSFIVKQMNGVAGDSGAFEEKISSLDTDGITSKVQYSVGKTMAPPWNDDANPDPTPPPPPPAPAPAPDPDTPASRSSRKLESSTYYSYFNTKSVPGIGSTMYLKNSPVSISLAALSDVKVPGTGSISDYNYNPYFATNFDNSSSVVFKLSGGQDSSNLNTGTFNYSEASQYGFYFSPEQHYAYFSGIFDSGDPDAGSGTEKYFGLYTPKQQTRVSNFRLKKTTGDSTILPSVYLQELIDNVKTNKLDRNYFSTNFDLSAQYAIPTTFYGSKLRCTADDKNGTINYELIPGIGANGIALDAKNTQWSYTLEAPIATDLISQQQTGFRSLKATKLKDEYDVPKGSSLYMNSIYAQVAASTDKTGAYRFKDEILNIIFNELISGNVGPDFSKDDILIDKLDFNNRTGVLSASISWKNIYDNDLNLKTTFSKAGNIEFRGFEQINETTQMTNTELDVKLPDTSIKEWLSQPNLNDMIKKLVIDNGYITGLPPSTDIKAEIDSSTIKDHPPSVTATISVNKAYSYDASTRDYLFKDYSLLPQKWYDLGTIRFFGFKEIFPTRIEIPEPLLDNGKTKYPSEFTEADAKKLVFDNVKNAPTGFSINNVIISSFTPLNVEGKVTFEAQLDLFYNSELVLENDASKFLPVSVTITGFKNALEPTSLPPNIFKDDWSSLTADSFSQEQVKLIVKSKFKGLLPDATITYESIRPINADGKILVTVSVDKWFGTNSVYHDTPTSFSTELIGFHKTAETILRSLTMNVKMQDTSPNMALPNVLKQKLATLIEGKPVGFEPIENILFKKTEDGDIVYETDNTTGTVTAYVAINLWYDADGHLHNTFKPLGEFVFTGFRATKQTVIPTTGWNNIGSGDIASSVAENRNRLLAMIDSRITGTKPSPWDASTDIIICDEDGTPTSVINFDNKEGTIDLYVKLNRFYDEKGILQTKWTKKPVHILMEGFQRLFATEVAQKIDVTTLDPTLGSKLPSDYNTPQKVKELLKPYVTSFISHAPRNFSIDSDMQISFTPVTKGTNPSNIQGKIWIDYKISNYYNKIGIIETDPNRLLIGSIELYGFTSVKPTTVNKRITLTGYGDVIASTLDKDDVLKIVTKYRDQIFVNQPPEPGVIIQTVQIANNKLNTAGELVVDIIYNNFFDETGNISNSNHTVRIVLTGFKKVKPTVIRNRISPGTKIDIYPSDLNSTSITNLLASEDILPLFIDNPTPTFSAADIRDVSNITPNNLNGTISFNVSIVNYFDSDGNIETIKPKTKNGIVINNLKTAVPSVFSPKYSLEPSDTIINNLPSQMKRQQLIDFVYSKHELLTSNLPTNWGINNIRDVKVVKADNLNGILTLQVFVNNYFDQKGVLQPIQTTIWNLTIDNFRRITPTTPRETPLPVPEFASSLPSSVTPRNLINTIMRYKQELFSSLPEGFNSSNVIIKKIRANNIDGSLSVDISLTSYYDRKGDIKGSSEPLDCTIKLNGFKNVSATSFVSTYAVSDVENIVPQECDDKQLKDIVYYNFNDIIKSTPEGFSINNIIDVSRVSFDNAAGTVEVGIKITNYYDERTGEIERSNLKSDTVTFTGFKHVGPTKVTSSDPIDVEVSHGIFPDDYSEISALELVKKNYNKILDPLPIDFDASNIIRVNEFTPDNLTGTIRLSVIVNNYFDENSNISRIPKPFVFTLGGFSHSSQTIINEDVTLDSISTMSMDKMDGKDVIDLIMNHRDAFLNPVPESFSRSNIIFDSIINKNNKEGSMQVSLAYTNTYNEKGSVSFDAIPTIVTIRGFQKSTNVTELKVDRLKLPEYAGMLAQNLAANSNKVKELIFSDKESIFTVLPSDFSYSDLVVTSITYNNLVGELYVDMSLSRYYDDESSLIYDSTKPRIFNHFIFSGFMSVKPTELKNNTITLDSLSTEIASSLTDLIALRNIVWRNKDTLFTDLPKDFNINDINVEYNYANNNTGKLYINVNIDKWYNTKGEVQNNNRPYPIIISGFKNVSPTEVNHEVTINFPTNIDATAYHADTITIQELRTLIAYNKENIFTSIPDSFDEIDIQNINIDNVDNLNGSITISFSYVNYYGKDAELEKNINATADKIVLNGFFKIESTRVIPNWSVTNTESDDFLPSEIASDSSKFNQLNANIQSKKEEIFAGTLPSADTVVSLKEIKSYDNLHGTAIVEIVASQYFDEKANLINDPKSFTLAINGFKFISNYSTLAGNGLSVENSNLDINVFSLGESYGKIFSNIAPSNIESSPQVVLDPLNEALSASNILVQNGAIGIDATNPIQLVRLTYMQNSANDNKGTIKLTAYVSNYWDSTNGTFHMEPLPVVITLSGFKTNNSNSAQNTTQIIFFVLIIAAVLIITLLIGLIIAKLPRFSKKI